MGYTLRSSDISIIAVPTPTADNDLYNLSYLENVSKSIVKSTIIPGTIEKTVSNHRKTFWKAGYQKGI